ncbi:hypothetical protein G4B88_024231, partial [Cannabis sativa]
RTESPPKEENVTIGPWLVKFCKSEIRGKEEEDPKSVFAFQELIMDSDSWSARLSSASKQYQSALQSRSEFPPIEINSLVTDMFMGFEEIDGDDDIREEFPCPFCSDYFDIVGLCCHIDEEHPVEAKNGVCPVCAMRVGVDMVAHITLQHGNIFKISFSYNFLFVTHNRLTKQTVNFVQWPSYLCVRLCYSTLNSLTSTYMQHKRKTRKGGSHSTTLSLLRKELREGNLQSLFGGSSCLVSSSNAAPDPLLSSFILPMADDFGSVQPPFLTETSSAKKSSTENVSERKVQPAAPPLSVKDKEEKAKRCQFVQGMLLSTILDDGL